MIFIPDFCPLHFAVASLRCKYNHFLGANKRFAEKSSFCNVHFIKTRRFIVWRPRTFCRFPEDESWRMYGSRLQRTAVCLAFGERMPARCFSASGIARRRQAAVGDDEGPETVKAFSRANAHARIRCFSFFPFTASPSMHKCTVAQAVRGEGFAEKPFTRAFTAPDGDFGAVAPAFSVFCRGLFVILVPHPKRVGRALRGRLQPEGGGGIDASPR